MGWLYEELEYQWLRWLPQESSPTIRKGGFYSVLVRPGFRIISLNMNYCNNKNWCVTQSATMFLSNILGTITVIVNIEALIPKRLKLQSECKSNKNESKVIVTNRKEYILFIFRSCLLLQINVVALKHMSVIR